MSTLDGLSKYIIIRVSIIDYTMLISIKQLGLTNELLPQGTIYLYSYTYSSLYIEIKERK